LLRLYRDTRNRVNKNAECGTPYPFGKTAFAE
jgi:hypothetical protein